MREAVSAQNCQTLEAICPLRLRHADNHQFTPCIVDVYVTVKRVQLKVEWKGAVYDSLTRLLKEQNVSAARPFSVLQYEVRHAMWAPLEALLPENVRSNRCCISDVLLPLDRPVKSNEEKIELNDAILIW